MQLFGQLTASLQNLPLYPGKQLQPFNGSAFKLHYPVYNETPLSFEVQLLGQTTFSQDYPLKPV